MRHNQTNASLFSDQDMLGGQLCTVQATLSACSACCRPNLAPVILNVLLWRPLGVLALPGLIYQKTGRSNGNRKSSSCSGKCIGPTPDLAPCRETSPQKRSGMARVLKGSLNFTCTRSSAIGMSHTCLCLPSYIAGTHLPTPEGWKAELTWLSGHVEACCGRRAQKRLS